MIRVQRCILDPTFTTLSLNMFCNHFHTQQLMLKKFNSYQKSVLSLKFLSKSKEFRKKQKFQKDPLMSVSSIFPLENTTGVTTRITRLNKIFMEKISEALVTSQYFSQLMDIGFEITQTKVQRGMSAIHIYWYNSQNVSEEELKSLLAEVSNYLCYELNLQHTLGRIPPLLFVKDLSFQNNMEVEKRLEIADFGPDGVNDDPIHIDTSFLVIKRNTDKLEGSLDNISQSAESSDGVKCYFPDNVIKIQPNILGVDREKIIKNVIKKCKESKGLHRLTEEPIPSSYTSYQIESEKSLLANLPIHSRTKDIKKWAAQFKKERQSRLRTSVEKMRAEDWELMNGSEMELKEHLDSQIDDDFDFEDIYEKESYDPDEDDRS